MKLLKKFSNVFPKELLRVYHLFMELSIKFTWYRELHFLTDQPIGVIQRRQRRFKGKLVSF
jgi:hypothetical protein